MTEQASKSLDSSDIVSEIADNKAVSDRQSYLSGKGVCPDTNWVYLFSHRRSLDKVNDKLKERFEVFVHKSIVCQRSEKGKVIRKEQPTIVGLIFIHGTAAEVQRYLNESITGLYLANDFSTGQPAEISNREMADFMKLSSLGSDEVRFMLNPLEYYSKGHQRIRITSGVLKGCEGYIVRIHRDRKLITKIDNMTVAIGGINKESFENADELIELRRNSTVSSLPAENLSEAEQEIDRYFFTPSNDLEAMAIAKNLTPLIVRFRTETASGNVSKVAESIIFTITEIAARFDARYFKSESVGITDVCTELMEVLREIIGSPVVDKAIKERILTEMESMMIRYPVLPIHEFEFHTAHL